jgi:hypothetical protein
MTRDLSNYYVFLAGTPTVTRYLGDVGSLFAWVDVEFPSGWKLCEVRTLPNGDGGRCIGTPARIMGQVNGQLIHEWISDFATLPSRADLEQRILAAVNGFDGHIEERCLAANFQRHRGQFER